jgi:hypothetical protein
MTVIRVAETAAEREAVQRFRYDVYVDELHRYGARADHDRRMLVDVEDDRSWLFYAVDGVDLVASTRITWGGHGFSDRQIDQYQLAPFLAELPHETISVGERVTVRPDQRGSEVTGQLMAATTPIQREHGVLGVFGAFEPHLVSMYLAKTLQRPYADRNINHADAGYLVPMLSLVGGPEAFRGLGDGAGVPRCIQAAVDSTGTIRSPLLEDPDTFAAHVDGILDGLDVPAFEGLDPTGRARCTARSIAIRCFEGDRVITRGSAARNLYLVLRGQLAIGRTDGGRTIRVEPGDVIGEDSYLSKGVRTYDVDVVGSEAELLSLSDGSLRGLVDDAPAVSETLTANLLRVSAQRA